MPKNSAEPWEKPAPKKSKHTKLTPASKVKAKASAKRAGRPYPSLVDNMNAAKAQKKEAAPKKKSSASPRRTRAKTSPASRTKKAARSKSASPSA